MRNVGLNLYWFTDLMSWGCKSSDNIEDLWSFSGIACMVSSYVPLESIGIGQVNGNRSLTVG